MDQKTIASKHETVYFNQRAAAFFGYTCIYPSAVSSLRKIAKNCFPEFISEKFAFSGANRPTCTRKLFSLIN